MRRTASWLLATAAIATVPAAQAQSAKELKYAHFQSADLGAPKHAAALAFESCVESKTGGSIDVQVYPAGQLASDNEVMESLQLDTI